MRRFGRRRFGGGILAWLWANPIALAAVVLLIVAIVVFYIRKELAEAKESEKLRKK